jgi:aryl-alcohol dehydrogenase-like predicted oxidoreductase
VIGFGAWAIGGPAMAGDVPIGWGAQSDEISRSAIQRALELGITFFDTADFYGLGHSEILLGEQLRNEKGVVIATKVGHRLNDDGSIRLDYTKKHLLEACEQSLRRLNRDAIDLYQLHSARMTHLEQGECIEAMQRLVEKGNIRYWGLSLNTFEPGPEAEFLMKQNLGQGFQLVLNLLNRRALPVVQQAHENGYGVIARMPLQFGMLTGKFAPETTFARDDHRSFRLNPEIIGGTNSLFARVWKAAEGQHISRTRVALGFLTKMEGVSTSIPGIRTAEQAELNAEAGEPLPQNISSLLDEISTDACAEVTSLMQAQG